MSNDKGDIYSGQSPAVRGVWWCGNRPCQKCMDRISNRFTDVIQRLKKRVLGYCARRRQLEVWTEGMKLAVRKRDGIRSSSFHS